MGGASSGAAEPSLWRVPSLSANVSVPAIRVAIDASSSSATTTNPTPISDQTQNGSRILTENGQHQSLRNNSSSESDTPIAGATLLAMPQHQQLSSKSRGGGEDSMRPPPPRAPATVRSGQGQLPTSFAGFLPKTAGAATLGAGGVSSSSSSAPLLTNQPLRTSFALPLSEMITSAAAPLVNDSGLSRSALSFLPSSDLFGAGGGASSSAFFSASASGLGLGGLADSRNPSAFQPGFSASLGGFGVSSSSSSSASSSFSSSSSSSSSAANRGFVKKAAATGGDATNKRKRGDGKEGSSDPKRQQR